ncbi:MAG TPA: GAF domain-containing protein, partial [Terriglobales bacterium]|nr:GAF domain-containing protein [Terriglobales bacterium]
MATRSPAISYAELAAALLSSSEVAPRARLIAEQAAQFVPGGAVVVYTVDESGLWVPRATDGEVAFSDAAIEFDFGTLGMMGAKRQAMLFAGSELAREAYAHLNIRRTLVSLAAVPLLIDADLVGALELLSFTAPMAPEVLSGLGELARLAAMGLAAGMAYEAERNTSLESISRVTQLYDLEKVFNSTLEMDELLPIITAKFRELLDTQAVNLWLVQGDSLLLASQAGTDVTAEPGATLKAGGGAVWEVSESGEALAINEPGDERLAKRNAGLEEGAEGAVFSLMATPVVHGGAVVGVAEAVNRMDGQPFDEDDLFLLQNVTEAAAGALHNASLLLAERKVEILETLVQVSREITSTLNLERVMQAIVTGPSAVIPYERACIALEQSGKLQLKAISSM